MQTWQLIFTDSDNRRAARFLKRPPQLQASYRKLLLPQAASAAGGQSLPPIPASAVPERKVQKASFRIEQLLHQLLHDAAKLGIILELCRELGLI